MISRLSTIILLLSFTCIAIFAGETGKISGIVSDKSDGTALPGANIIVTERWEGDDAIALQQPLGASSDIDGAYFIINVPPGRYNVEVAYIGYAAQKIVGVQVQVDKTTRLDFQLDSEIIAGEEVSVTAFKAGTVERDVSATKVTYSVSNVEELPGINDIGDILSLQADADDGHFRGGRTGEALFLVNGASIVNPLSSGRAFTPMTIGLEEVEVYTSGFSAEYGNVQSGVINMVAKEARTDKWETKLDISSTNAYYKTHGGSVFSREYNDYFERLNNTEEWAVGTDPISGAFLWSHFGLGFDRYLPELPIQFPPPPPLSLEDSIRTAELIRILWLQSVRQIGLEYDKPDYRVDFSSGGPIGNNLSLFVAAQQRVNQPVLPTGRTDVSRQLATNMTFRPNDSHKIQLIYNYNTGFDNGIGANYFRWFESVLNVIKRKDNTHQFAFNWNYVLSSSTFLDIKMSRLSTFSGDYVDLLGDSTLTELYTNSINWRDYTAPTGYQVGKFQTTNGTERTKTYTFNTSFTSQLDKYNLLKAGVQFHYYDLNVDWQRSRSSASSLRLENYSNSPYEGAVYVQDKLEYEGMVANIGLRLDFYDFNTDYFTNIFSPYENPNFDPTDPDQGAFYDTELAATDETGLSYAFQPRIGVSFPVSERAVLHFNYGIFTQRPAFERIFVDRLKTTEFPDYDRLGNPQLEPERTISYDVGLVYGLPFGLSLDLSSYLKDVSNLLQFASYQNIGGSRYSTFINREYANIKGFQAILKKRGGIVSGSAHYNWESATGKSGSAIGSGVRAEFFEDDNLPDLLPAPEDVFLDHNRKHKLVLQFGLKTPGNRGFSLFRGLSANTVYRVVSGRPFTFDASGQGLQFNLRTPTEHNVDLRIDKRLTINGTDTRLYLEAFNLFDNKIFHYGRTFQDGTDGENAFKLRFVENPEAALTQTDFDPYFTSVEAYLYDNRPRHYRFGVEFDF